VRPYIAKELCDNCKECITFCPYDVFSLDKEDVVVLNPQDCIECYTCAHECPAYAIFMDD